MRMVVALCLAAALLRLAPVSDVLASGPSDPALDRADSLYDRHAFRELQELATEQLARARAALGDSSLQAAEWLYRRAVARGALDDVAGARTDTEAAVAIRTVRLGPLDPGLAQPLCGLASCAMATGDLAAAERFYAHALEVVRSSQPIDSLALASTLIQQARLLDARARHGEAVTQVERAIAYGSRQSGVKPQDVAFWWDCLGIVLYRAGREVRAEKALRRALAGLEAVYGPDDAFTGVACNNLAMILEALGDAAGARRSYERALAIEERVRGSRSMSCGRIRYNLAVASLGIGDSRSALAHGLEALSILEGVTGSRSLESWRVLTLLGQAMANLGDSASAERNLREALAISSEKLGPEHPFTGLDAEALAAFLASTGRLAEARSLLESFTPRVEERLGPTHRHTLRLRGRLAQVLLQAGSSREAWEQAWRACSDASEAFGEIFGTASERRALLYARRFSRPLDTLISAARADPDLREGRGDSTFAMVSLYRGRILDYLVDRGWLGQAPQQDSLVRAVVEVREDLAGLVLKGQGKDPPEVYQERLEQARWRKDETEAALARSDGRYARWINVRELLGGIDLATIASALPHDAAAVQYVRYWDRAEQIARGRSASPIYRDLAFVLRHKDGGKPGVQMIALAPAAAVDSLVRSYRREIADPDPDPLAMRAIGRRLHDVLWAPLVPHIGPARLVFLLPDGPLHFVDFATLVAPDGTFLIEKTRTHRLTSLRDLVRLAARAQHARPPSEPLRLLALADPEFGIPGAGIDVASSENDRASRAGAEDRRNPASGHGRRGRASPHPSGGPHRLAPEGASGGGGARGAARSRGRRKHDHPPGHARLLSRGLRWRGGSGRTDRGSTRIRPPGGSAPAGRPPPRRLQPPLE